MYVDKFRNPEVQKEVITEVLNIIKAEEWEEINEEVFQEIYEQVIWEIFNLDCENKELSEEEYEEISVGGSKEWWEMEVFDSIYIQLINLIA
jgi:hypothetical protein